MTMHFKTAECLEGNCRVYAVFNCGARPNLHAVQNPVRLGWQPVVKVEHYLVGAEVIRRG